MEKYVTLFNSNAFILYMHLTQFVIEAFGLVLLWYAIYHTFEDMHDNTYEDLALN